MESRIVETVDGWFYPQYKPGWFSRWRGYKPDADRASFPTLEIWIAEHDPAKSARFPTEADRARFCNGGCRVGRTKAKPGTRGCGVEG
jgi:hypothetical protein